MASRSAHVIATEGRTLCGLLASHSPHDLLPLTEWLSAYRLNPALACSKCRKALLQYQDTARSIRHSDALHRPQCNAYYSNDNDPL